MSAKPCLIGGLAGMTFGAIVNAGVDGVIFSETAAPLFQRLLTDVAVNLAEPLAALLGAICGFLVGQTWEQRPRVLGWLLLAGASLLLAAQTGFHVFRGSLTMCFCDGEEENPFHPNTFWMALPLLWMGFMTLLYGGTLLIKSLDLTTYRKRMAHDHLS